MEGLWPPTGQSNRVSPDVLVLPQPLFGSQSLGSLASPLTKRETGGPGSPVFVLDRFFFLPSVFSISSLWGYLFCLAKRVVRSKKRRTAGRVVGERGLGIPPIQEAESFALVVDDEQSLNLDLIFLIQAFDTHRTLTVYSALTPNVLFSSRAGLRFTPTEASAHPKSCQRNSIQAEIRQSVLTKILITRDASIF